MTDGPTVDAVDRSCLLVKKDTSPCGADVTTDEEGEDEVMWPGFAGSPFDQASRFAQRGRRWSVCETFRRTQGDNAGECRRGAAHGFICVWLTGVVKKKFCGWLLRDVPGCHTDSMLFNGPRTDTLLEGGVSMWASCA